MTDAREPTTTILRYALLAGICVVSFEAGRYFGKFPVMDNTRVAHVDPGAKIFGNYYGQCKWWDGEQFCAVDAREQVVGEKP